MEQENEVLKEGYLLFSKVGYKSTTMREIADKAGINESTLYRNYDSKEKLFYQIIKHYSQIDLLTVKRIDAKLSYKIFEQDLSILLTEYLKITYQYADLIRIFYINMKAVPLRKENTFYVVPALQCHFKLFLYQYDLGKCYKKKDLDLACDLALSHMSRMVLDAYGHNHQTTYQRMPKTDCENIIHQVSTFLMLFFAKNGVDHGQE